ncbi:MAG: 4Fe-4S binding domain protein [Candidatus Moranbacteria bacterium GW2011_GWE1_35_17]|nr:MAG: 4Fe-4S binding domain protein [Candidatus Moranbacteria bacterium GW2011_GWE1_35_17]KKP81808.1 MAG: 4Fe-4S binding domain protein [Candidatus Moranbacteria bacterium GW2011_GWF1_35_5]KKP82101.1 MAG: 4Fe-4S binding domain protein [Candidatus Moranbacteria bacterium GW2011_GWF2_35_54]
MPVLINFKICDNAQECNGVAVCPTGALSWDKEKKSIKIDNEKCVSCGICEKACMVSAIHVARNENEYNKIKKEIDEDPRKVSDLFVDRYGATPIHTAFQMKSEKFNLEVISSDKLVGVEIYNDDSIECLRKSIPVKEIFKGMDIKFRKMKNENDKILNDYKIKSFPALLFFKGGKLLGKIEGYYDNAQKDILLDKVNVIIKK